MKIFLDDIRDAPDDSWTIARDAEEFVKLVRGNRGDIDVISFDHDLGEFTSSGNELLKWIEREIAFGCYHGLDKTEFVIHSANPVGRKNMQAAIDSINRMRK